VRDLLSHPTPLRPRVLAAAAELSVSRRTVYRWIKQYRDALQRTSLVTGRRGRPRSVKLLDSPREQVIDRVIQETYLSRPRARPETIYKEVNVRCAAENRGSVSRNAVLAHSAA
jgi:transposase